MSCHVIMSCRMSYVVCTVTCHVICTLEDHCLSCHNIMYSGGNAYICRVMPCHRYHVMSYVVPLFVCHDMTHQCRQPWRAFSLLVPNLGAPCGCGESGSPSGLCTRRGRGCFRKSWCRQDFGCCHSRWECLPCAESSGSLHAHVAGHVPCRLYLSVLHIIPPHDECVGVYALLLRA